MSTCKWCGGVFRASRDDENGCNPHCSLMWRRERDRTKRAKVAGTEYEVVRDTGGRVIRHCVRCKGRVSAWNKGHHCNQCWQAMTLEQRTKQGKNGDAYDPGPALLAECKELVAYGLYDGDQSGDPAPGVNAGTG